MSMSNTPDHDNVSSTVRSNIQNPESILEKEIPRGTSKSISNTNSITNIVSTSTDTDAGDGAVAKAMSSASLSNKIDISSSKAPTNSQGNDILDTNPLLNVKTEIIPLVFTNPSNVSYVDDVYHDNIPPSPFTALELLTEVDKIKNFWIKDGICKTELTSELLISSKFTFLNGNTISNKYL